jgi:ABC-2 type transport system ATP-binding protein
VPDPEVVHTHPSGRAGDAGPAPASAGRLLEVIGVGYRYGIVRALSSINLDVPPGTVFGVIGPNGSGKSTLLRLCAGLMPLQEGTIRVAGADLSGEQHGTAGRLAYVPDVPSGFERLTIAEYLGLVNAIYRLPMGFMAVARIQLEAMGLARLADRQLGALSEGTRRKVALVAAAATTTPLLLIDEATAALDPEAVMVLEGLLGWFKTQGCSALVATQDLDFAERTCDTVALLKDGTLHANGTPAQLRTMHRTDSLRGVFAAVTGLSDTLDRLEHDLDAARAG